MKNIGFRIGSASFSSFRIPVLIMLFLGFCVLVNSGCRREGMEGPELKDLYGPFLVEDSLSVSSDSVDFINGEKLHFLAKFSKRVYWTITITGHSTGAQKTLTGFDRELDALNSEWDGSTTTLPVFRDEEVEITISVEDEPYTETVSATLLSGKSYTGVLISDFESDVFTGPNTFYQDGVSFFQDNSFHIAGQGESFFNMGGTVPWDWLIGMVEFTAEQTVSLPTFPLSENPDNVFFNIFVYGQSSTSETRLEFQFREDENGDGIFDAGSEDIYGSVQTMVSWDGWKLLSFPYSEVSSAAPTGNGILESAKIHSVTALLLAPKQADSPTGQPVPGRADIDMLIFTQGAPLQP